MDPPMKWWMVVTIVLAVVRIADAAETGNPLTLDLQMKSEARVPADVLEHARDEVALIFAGAGLTVRWTDTTPRFTVKIVGQVLGFDRATSPVMGVALRTANSSMAQIFFKQVQDFAHAYDVDLSTMLAYVIVHEIGHLLLGTAHSPTGVMQANWDRALVHDVARGSLTFTEAQATRMRPSSSH
jgi:hypothetical protein